MRRSTLIVIATGLALVACSGGKNRSLTQYYDPQSLFSTFLPADNTIQVASPQPQSAGAPSILSGVVSTPPMPSPSANAGFGGIGGQLVQSAPADQTVYEIFAITTDSFSSLDNMVLNILTADPKVDVRREQPTDIGGMDGRLVVADVVDGGQVTSSLAVAFTLGEEGTGYLIAAIFPPGQWDAERSDFEKVLASFRADAPPGVQTIPLGG